MYANVRLRLFGHVMCLLCATFAHDSNHSSIVVWCGEVWCGVVWCGVVW